MPKQTGNAGVKGLLQKYGDRLKAAHDSHKEDETEFSGSNNLPPNINGGVAQLEDCEFQQIKPGKRDAGEYQFYASGTVLEPLDHTFEDPVGSGRMRTVKTQGLRTFIVEPLYDTPNRQSRKTIDEHVKWIYNELRKLGIDTANLEFEDLEGAVASLRDTKPIFKFRTWKGTKATEGPYKDKEPMVSHFWDGLVEEDYELPPDESQDNDRTVAPPPKAASNGTTSKPTTPAPKKSAKVDNSPPQDLEFGDIDSLLATAKSSDSSPVAVQAQSQLEAMAIAAGKTAEDVANAESWEEVVGWISEGDEGQVQETTEEPESKEKEIEEEEVLLPAKGEVWKTFLADPNNPKVKSKKPVQVEVVSVNKKNSTCEVKSLVDKKVHKGIKFGNMIAMGD